MKSSRIFCVLFTQFFFAHFVAITVQNCKACCDAVVDDYDNWPPGFGGGTCSVCTAYRAACKAGCEFPTSNTVTIIACSTYQQQCNAGKQWINLTYTVEGFAQTGVPVSSQRYCSDDGTLSVTANPTRSPTPPTHFPTNLPTTPTQSLSPTVSPNTEGESTGEPDPIILGAAGVGLLVVLISGVLLIYRRALKEEPEGIEAPKLIDDVYEEATRKINEATLNTLEKMQVQREDQSEDGLSTVIPYVPRSVYTETSAKEYPSIKDINFRVKFEFHAENQDELSANEGSRVRGIRQVDESWYLVRNQYGKSGMIPISYLEPADDEETIIPYEAPPTF